VRYNDDKIDNKVVHIYINTYETTNKSTSMVQLDSGHENVRATPISWPDVPRRNTCMRSTIAVGRSDCPCCNRYLTVVFVDSSRIGESRAECIQLELLLFYRCNLPLPRCLSLALCFYSVFTFLDQQTSQERTACIICVRITSSLGRSMAGVRQSSLRPRQDLCNTYSRSLPSRW